jgi:hypothetical protein
LIVCPLIVLISGFGILIDFNTIRILRQRRHFFQLICG